MEYCNRVTNVGRCHRTSPLIPPQRQPLPVQAAFEGGKDEPATEDGGTKAPRSKGGTGQGAAEAGADAEAEAEAEAEASLDRSTHAVNSYLAEAYSTGVTTPKPKPKPEGGAGKSARGVPSPKLSLTMPGAFEHSIVTEEDMSPKSGTVEDDKLLL